MTPEQQTETNAIVTDAGNPAIGRAALTRLTELNRALNGDDRNALTAKVYAALDKLPAGSPGLRDHVR